MNLIGKLYRTIVIDGVPPGFEDVIVNALEKRFGKIEQWEKKRYTQDELSFISAKCCPLFAKDNSNKNNHSNKLGDNSINSISSIDKKDFEKDENAIDCVDKKMDESEDINNKVCEYRLFVTFEEELNAMAARELYNNVSYGPNIITIWLANEVKNNGKLKLSKANTDAKIDISSLSDNSNCTNVNNPLSLTNVSCSDQSVTKLIMGTSVAEARSYDSSTATVSTASQVKGSFNKKLLMISSYNGNKGKINEYEDNDDNIINENEKEENVSEEKEKEMIKKARRNAILLSLENFNNNDDNIGDNNLNNSSLLSEEEYDNFMLKHLIREAKALSILTENRNLMLAEQIRNAIKSMSLGKNEEKKRNKKPKVENKEKVKKRKREK